jgi:capsular exopolysaccharide synthesis family protein
MKKSKSKQSILEYYDNESSRAIEFRRLARNIRLYNNPSEIRSILVTSAAKHEGKSLIAANLAIAIAKREEEKKVLLIDGDLRRPTIHSLFGIKRVPGLVSLLEGKAELYDVVHDTELINLKIIPSGQAVDSPSQLLKGAKDILDKCRESFDVVICDSPPVVPADDASMIAPYMEGVLMVVMAGKTDKMIVKRAMEILDGVNAKILGIALNNLHKMLPYYYDYGYYRYKYDRKYTANGKQNKSE